MVDGLFELRYYTKFQGDTGRRSEVMEGKRVSLGPQGTRIRGP